MKHYIFICYEKKDILLKNKGCLYYIFLTHLNFKDHAYYKTNSPKTVSEFHQ